MTPAISAKSRTASKGLSRIYRFDVLQERFKLRIHTFSRFRAVMVWSILAGMAMTVGNLVAQEVGNPDQGLRLAHTLCAECHLVDKLPEQSPNLIAPSFERIAKTPGMNSAALTAALRTSHESMPNIIIKGTDLSDVIAYILSLNHRR